MSRSILVVLLVDTVNSTAIMSELGQDRMEHLAAMEMDTLRRSVESTGGQVVSSTGDGLFATFATAASALDAASAMHREVGRLNDGNRFGVDVRVRVILAASDLAVENGEMRGVAPVIAARLEDHAGAGETVCTEAVRLLAQGWGDYHYERLEPMQLRGLTEAIVAHRVLEPLADVLGMPETLDVTKRFDFVGRAPEWKVLTTAWEAATRYAGSMVVIAGEAGVGKTRLCREFARAVRADGAIVLHGSCAELTGLAFDPFVQPLRHCLARVSDVGELMTVGTAELARIVPEIKTRVPSSEGVEPDAETARHRLFDAVTAWLLELSRRAPLLFVLDDLSWADEASINLLRHLVDRIPHERVLVVSSYRPADANEHARRFLLEDRSAYLRADLAGFDHEQALIFAEQLLGGALDSSGRDAIGAITRRVGGNPLYLGELITHLVESAGIIRDDDRWIARVDGRASAVPTSVGEVVRHRIDRLGEASQQVLRVAAMIGTSFSTTLLFDLLESTPGECLEALDHAAEAGFVQRAGDDRYEFTHAVFRDVVYYRVSDLRRVAEHLRVGEAIEARFEADLDPWLDVLAFQFEQSAELAGPGRAIDYLRRAGRQAETSLGNDHAVGFYRRALQLIERGRVDDDRMRCQLLIDLGNAQRRSGQSTSKDTLLQATSCAVELGDHDLAARAVLGLGRGTFTKAGSVDTVRVGALRDVLGLVGPARTAVRARLLAALSAELIFDDDPDAAQRASDEAMSIARELGDPATLVSAIGQRLVALWRADCVDERLRLGKELDAIRRLAGSQRSGQFLSAMTVYCQAALEGGELDLADELLSWIEETAVHLRQPATVGFAKLRLASRSCIAGRLIEAEQLATDAYQLCLGAGQDDAEAFYVGQLFTIRWHQGRLEEVDDLIQDCAKRYPGIRAFTAASATCAAEVGDLDRCRNVLDEVGASLESIRFDLNWLPAMALTAHTASVTGDAELAARVRDLIAPYRRQFIDNASTFFGSVEHYYAMCSAVVQDHVAADTAFEAALVAHERLRSPPLRARTQLEYATALARRESSPRAVELAESALAHADQLGYRTIALRSSALLRRLRGAS